MLPLLLLLLMPLLVATRPKELLRCGPSKENIKIIQQTSWLTFFLLSRQTPDLGIPRDDLLWCSAAPNPTMLVTMRGEHGGGLEF